MPCPPVTVYKKLILINKHKRVAIKYYMIKNREFMDTLWSYQTYIYTMIIVSRVLTAHTRDTRYL